MLNKHKIPDVLPAAVYRFSVVIVMAIAVLFQGPGPMASEVTASGAAPGGSSGSVQSSVAPPVMDIPLSTLMGPGDVLRIKAFPDTASFISGFYTILDSGYVMLPVLGRVQVTHTSIMELNKQLTDAYARYTAYPSVQVEPLIHLLLLGGFLRPGVYLVNPLYPFSNALSAAGGTVRDDGLKLLRWERNGSILKSDLTAEVEGTKSLWELGFKSDDQICITQRTKKDILPVVSFITSTIVASGTLVVALLVLMK
jgi:hypothetical protein